MIKKPLKKISCSDVHIKAIFAIYYIVIVEGWDRPEEWKEAHHIFPRWP